MFGKKEKKPAKIIQWREVKCKGPIKRTQRAKVPGGWLVLLLGEGLTFVPDPNHEWELDLEFGQDEDYEV